MKRLLFLALLLALPVRVSAEPPWDYFRQCCLFMAERAAPKGNPPPRMAYVWLKDVDGVSTFVMRRSDGVDVALGGAGAAPEGSPGGLTDAELRATPVPVSGTFWQTVQPISGTVTATGPLTDTQLRAAPVAVTGSFFQATQPVSISAMPSTPVTGTFWQALQPVSGTVTANAGTGTFAISGTVTANVGTGTQPVSGTVTANAGSGTFAVSGPATDAQLRAVPLPVSGTVTANAGTGTFAVSGPATDAQLRATPLPISGTVTANVGTGTQPVSGTFWQATQPVSLASAPTTPVTGTFWQATQPVSGAFFQATQPISAAALPLPSGASTDRTTAAAPFSFRLSDGAAFYSTNTAAQLPAALVSGRLDVNLGATITVPVSGTFWQATQPISGTVTATGPLTDTQLRAVAVPVSGAFFQATQPVSIATMPTTPVTGTFWQATQPVSGTVTATGPVTDAQLRATPVPVSGTVTATGPLTDAQLRALAVPVSGTVTVTPPTLTKGTQGATGLSVQELKDAGRVNIQWTAEVSPAAVAEALLTVTQSLDGAAVTTFTTRVVTAGKRLRVNSISMVVENTLGVNPKRAKLRMRFNTAGAVTTASPIQGTWAASVATAVNTIGQTAFEDFPDGIEYLGDGTKQVGFTLEFPDWVTAAQTGKVYITISAFEY